MTLEPLITFPLSNITSPPSNPSLLILSPPQIEALSMPSARAISKSTYPIGTNQSQSSSRMSSTHCRSASPSSLLAASSRPKRVFCSKMITALLKRKEVKSSVKYWKPPIGCTKLSMLVHQSQPQFPRSKSAFPRSTSHSSTFQRNIPASSFILTQSKSCKQ